MLHTCVPVSWVFGLQPTEQLLVVQVAVVLEPFAKDRMGNAHAQDAADQQLVTSKTVKYIITVGKRWAKLFNGSATRGINNLSALVFILLKLDR